MTSDIIENNKTKELNRKLLDSLFLKIMKRLIFYMSYYQIVVLWKNVFIYKLL